MPQVRITLRNGREDWRACTIVGRVPAPRSFAERGGVDWFVCQLRSGQEVVANPDCVRSTPKRKRNPAASASDAAAFAREAVKDPKVRKLLADVADSPAARKALRWYLSWYGPVGTRAAGALIGAVTGGPAGAATGISSASALEAYAAKKNPYTPTAADHAAAAEQRRRYAERQQLTEALRAAWAEPLRWGMVTQAEVNAAVREGRAPPRRNGGSRVQSLVFDRTAYTAKTAKAWAKSHGFRSGFVDVKANTLRIRQYDPSRAIPETYGTITLRPGVQAVVAVPR